MKKQSYLLLFLIICFILTYCSKLQKEMMVLTGTSREVTQNSAKVDGEIIDLGEGASQHGHCYGKTPDVNNTGFKTAKGVPKSTGNFTSELKNLEAGTKYYVKAYLSDGKETVYSSEISFLTVTGSPPSAPSIGTATAGNSQATVTFTAPVSNGGSPITGYTVTSSPDGFTGIGSASPITVTGLTNGTAYTFTVTATNTNGTGPSSSASNSATPSAPSTTPDAPTGVSATAGNAQATVTFTAPVSNGGSAITGYTVTSSPSGFIGTGSASPIKLTGLINGTAYTFTVTATNANGTGPSSAASNSVTPLPEVTNPTTGKVWMDRNLGANQVATSSTDAASYGDLYQWGRAADGHQIRTSGTTSTLSGTDTPGNANFILAPNSPYDWRSPQNDNLWQGVSGTNNPCPTGYRLPTEAEWNAERLSWSTNNSAGAFASPLKLPVAGSRSRSDGSLYGVGSYGSYWSSTVSSTYSRYLTFYNSNASMSTDSRAYGYSVRCIKDY